MRGTSLCHDSDGEAVLDGLGVRVRLGEFLGGALEVRASLFDVLLELLVVAVQLLVEVEVGVLNLGVPRSSMSVCTASSTCGRRALRVASLSFALS